MSDLGLRLTILIGPTVPVPVPPTFVESLQEVQVTHGDDQPSACQIRLRVGRSSPLDLIDYSVLANPLLVKPFNRVILVVTFGVVPQVLMDGFITHTELSPGNHPGTSTLTITAEDACVRMDMNEVSAEHPAQDETIIANKILLSYAPYGVIPMVIPPPVADPPIPVERTPVQQGTDLQYLRQMAARFGYVFYITPGPAPGMSTAYWGPPQRVGIPQKALSVNLGAHTNVAKIDFSNNARGPAFVQGELQDRMTNQAFPVVTFTSLRPPLAALPAWLVQQPDVRRRAFRQSGLNVAQAYARAQGETDASVDGVSARGELDALRYGSILQARGTVGVRGVGFNYDGFYYVKSVTHTLKYGDYKQSFELRRDGVGSLSPVLPA